MGRSLPLATVIASIPVGSSPSGVAVTPDGGKVYVTNTGTGESPGTVSVISTATDTVIATIGVGFGPTGIAVTPDGSKVYVANLLSNTVSVINAASDTVTATIPVGNFPIAFGMFIQPRPTFAGTPRSANCYGQSVATLATQFGGLIRAASALAFSSIRAMQDAIMAYCGG